MYNNVLIIKYGCEMISLYNSIQYISSMAKEMVSYV